MIGSGGGRILEASQRASRVGTTAFWCLRSSRRSPPGGRSAARTKACGPSCCSSRAAFLPPVPSAARRGPCAARGALRPTPRAAARIAPAFVRLLAAKVDLASQGIVPEANVAAGGNAPAHRRAARFGRSPAVYGARWIASRHRLLHPTGAAADRLSRALPARCTTRSRRTRCRYGCRKHDPDEA